MHEAGPDIWWRLDAEKQRLILTLYLQPGAKRTEVVGLHGDALKIKLAAPAVEGAANLALVKFLAEAFDVPEKQVTLKQGAHSRRKIVEIDETALGADALWKQVTG